jgi:hypothetical protein
MIQTTWRARRSARLLLVPLALVLAGCGGGSTERLFGVEAAIDGRSIADAGPSSPLRLDPREESTLSLTMTNRSDRTVEVRRVRLEGELLSLNFLTYDVRALAAVAPGETRTVQIPLDFFDLERQASGYLRAFVRVYDADDRRVSDDGFALDIRGDATSTMTMFAVGLFLVTALLIALNVRDLRRRTMPEQRFARGMRFLVPGLGLGLLLSVAFSILRIFPLPATSWAPLTLLPALAGFAIGYALVPGPGESADDDTDEDTDPLTDLDADDLVAAGNG